MLADEVSPVEYLEEANMHEVTSHMYTRIKYIRICPHCGYLLMVGMLCASVITQATTAVVFNYW